MKLRIRFKKYGPMRFIGHLDVMRFYQKAIRRAGIDVTYTTGFSPHQVMSFASPLGVGLTSNGEYMDIEVNSLPDGNLAKSPCEVVRQRLNDASVKGLDVAEVRILPENAENAMASVAAASYTVRFREDRTPELACDDVKMNHAIATFLAKKEIMINKETKRGSRQVDLRPGIYELSWKDGAFVMLVDASSAGNIKPIQVIGALLADNGEELKENALLVTREDVFTEIISENGERELISLGEIGFDSQVAGNGGVK